MDIKSQNELKKIFKNPSKFLINLKQRNQFNFLQFNKSADLNFKNIEKILINIYLKVPELRIALMQKKTLAIS